MTSPNTGIYVVAPAVEVGMVAMWFGFTSGFFIGIHAGVALPIFLMVAIAGLVFSAVYLAEFARRSHASRGAKFVGTLPLVTLLIVIGRLIYGIAVT